MEKNNNVEQDFNDLENGLNRFLEELKTFNTNEMRIRAFYDKGESKFKYGEEKYFELTFPTKKNNLEQIPLNDNDTIDINIRDTNVLIDNTSTTAITLQSLRREDPEDTESYLPTEEQDTLSLGLETGIEIKAGKEKTLTVNQGEKISNAIKIDELTEKLNEMISKFNDLVKAFKNHKHSIPAMSFLASGQGTPNATPVDVQPTTESASNADNFNKDDYAIENIIFKYD